MYMKKFLVADDHFIVRTGVSVLIKEEFLNAQIDECGDGNNVMKKLETTVYDLAVIDIGMPGTDAINLLKNIFSRYPDQKVLILTMSSEEIYAKKYLQLGVMGFITKEAPSSELRKAIVSILDNKRYISPRMQEVLNRDTLEGKPNNPFDRLSTREMEVMMHLVEGKNVSEIAGILYVHTSTVGTHKARIMQKLGVNNVLELNKMARLFDNSGN